MKTIKKILKALSVLFLIVIIASIGVANYNHFTATPEEKAQFKIDNKDRDQAKAKRKAEQRVVDLEKRKIKLEEERIKEEKRKLKLAKKEKENAEQKAERDAVMAVELKAMAEEERLAKIAKSFSAWDASHYGLVEFVKKSLNDPKSFEHDETKYWDKGDHLVLLMSYRAQNVFGGVIPSSVKAKASLDGDILEILE